MQFIKLLIYSVFLLTINPINSWHDLSDLYKDRKENVLMIENSSFKYFAFAGKINNLFYVQFQKNLNDEIIKPFSKFLYFLHPIEVRQLFIRKKFEPEKVYVLCRHDQNGFFLIRFNIFGYDDKYGIHYLSQK